MKIFNILLILILSLSPIFAAEFGSEISDEEKATFDSILVPIEKIYNFVKYAATSIAALYLIFVGLVLVTAGNDQHKRDNAKTQAGYILVGLIIIWVAPIVVKYLTS